MNNGASRELGGLIDLIGVVFCFLLVITFLRFHVFTDEYFEVKKVNCKVVSFKKINTASNGQTIIYDLKDENNISYILNVNEKYFEFYVKNRSDNKYYLEKDNNFKSLKQKEKIRVEYRDIYIFDGKLVDIIEI